MRHNNYRLTRERCKIFSLEFLTEVDGDQSASEQAHHAAETTKTWAPPWSAPNAWRRSRLRANDVLEFSVGTRQNC